MKLKLEIKMDNAAFEDRPGIEAARILRDFADTIEEVPMPVGSSENLRDINGNTVGQAKITR